jgi:hypothetical protein
MDVRCGRVLIVGDGNFSYSLSLAHRLRHERGNSDDSNTARVAVTATSYDSEASIRQKYRESAGILKQLLALNSPGKSCSSSTTSSSSSSSSNAAASSFATRVLHGVDATRLDEHRGVMEGAPYDDVVFNHPHSGLQEGQDYRRHRSLLAHFFDATVRSGVVAVNGRVHVTLANEQAEAWQIRRQADKTLTRLALTRGDVNATDSDGGSAGGDDGGGGDGGGDGGGSRRGGLVSVRDIEFDFAAFPGFRHTRHQTSKSFPLRQASRTFEFQRVEQDDAAAVAVTAPTLTSSSVAAAATSPLPECHICQERFASRAALQKHMRSLQPSDRVVWCCAICHRVFREERAIQQHYAHVKATLTLAKHASASACRCVKKTCDQVLFAPSKSSSSSSSSSLSSSTSSSSSSSSVAVTSAEAALHPRLHAAAHTIQHTDGIARQSTDNDGDGDGDGDGNGDGNGGGGDGDGGSGSGDGGGGGGDNGGGGAGGFGDIDGCLRCLRCRGCQVCVGAACRGQWLLVQPSNNDDDTADARARGAIATSRQRRMCGEASK